MIFFLFLLFKSIAFSKDIKLTFHYRNMPISEAEVGVKFNKQQIDSVTDKNGEATFDVDEVDRIYIKAKKEGYRYKGYFGKVEDTKLEMDPLKAAVAGRVMIEGVPVVGQEVQLDNLWTGENFVYKTNVNGRFYFERVPIMQKHKITILKEGYVPITEHVYLNSEVDSENELYLHEEEYVVNVKVRGNKNNFIFIEGISCELDAAGITSITLRDVNRDSIKVIVDSKEYIKKIKKGDRYQNLVVEIKDD